MNNNGNDDDRAQWWAEAQRAMYGRCAIGMEDDEELHAIKEDGITIDSLSSSAIAASRPTKIMTVTINITVASAIAPATKRR